MIDSALIGITAAELMEELPDCDGEVIAVGLIVIVDEDDETFARIKCSRDRKFEQLGLFSEALHVVNHGELSDE